MNLKALVIAVFALFVASSSAEAARHHHRHHTYRVMYDSGTIVSHPSGCPGSAFCGCGASVRVFGRPIRELFLASNWFKFPRTYPAPGMVAVRSHHVFVLEAQISENTWQVYDANSGGHRTRIHARNLAGYAVVNPHGHG